MSSVILLNPKFIQNVATIVRTCAAFGIENVYFTGKRVSLEIEKLPREFKIYKEVIVKHDNYAIDRCEKQIPVAIEFRQDFQDLIKFSHPPEATYIFGPEDGDIPSYIMKLCHHFVHIPTKYCLNVATAVSIILYDRISKR